MVERMAGDLGVDVANLVGRSDLVRRLDLARYVDERRGEPTLRDILAELEKPGRDPREAFAEVGFRDDVTEFEHLREGMILAGVVTNVTAFGAFVDVGVHQRGAVAAARDLAISEARKASSDPPAYRRSRSSTVIVVPTSGAGRSSRHQGLGGICDGEEDATPRRG